MKAVILAGGRGVRLRPYTTCIPKPLVPIGDEMTMIEILATQLRRQGFTDISLAIGHMGELIRSYVGDGSQWGIPISCWDEDEPLGTAGPLVGHTDELPEHFLVMNADLLCDLDMGEMLRTHIARDAGLTVACHRQTMRIEFGVLDVEGDRLNGFEEKPEFNFDVSMGIYAVSRALIENRQVRPLGFDEIMLEMLARGESPHTHQFDGYWLDIGRPDDYDRANRDFESLRPRLFREPVLSQAEPVPSQAEPVAEVIDLRPQVQRSPVDDLDRLAHPSVSAEAVGVN